MAASKLISVVNLRLSAAFSVAVDEYAERNRLSRNSALVRLIEVGLTEEAARIPKPSKPDRSKRV